jgi:hypothetical protein
LAVPCFSLEVGFLDFGEEEIGDRQISGLEGQGQSRVALSVWAMQDLIDDKVVGC